MSKELVQFPEANVNNLSYSYHVKREMENLSQHSRCNPYRNITTQYFLLATQYFLLASPSSNGDGKIFFEKYSPLMN